MNPIGKIERVPLRTVWRHEAYELTTWLQNNLDVVNSVTDLNLSVAEREFSAGAYFVDLVAEDDALGTVIIENQLERSDHDHLGKLLTYLAMLEAEVAVWIVADPRPEHVRAVSWLNESTDARFYLLKVEAVRIGDSLPAPLLTAIVNPSEEARAAGNTRRELSGRHLERHAFWTKFLDFASSKTSLHAGLRPRADSALGIGTGMVGVTYYYVANQTSSRVELYIDRGSGAEEENRRIFDELHLKKGEIEASFGEPLDWQPLEHARACRIAKQIDLGGYRTEAQFDGLFEALLEHMTRLVKALRPHIDQLREQPDSSELPV